MGVPAPLFLGVLPLGPLGVYIFFSISGYLIAQSWDRDSHALRFFIRRGLRIFPALIVVTILTVFVLGPAITTLPIWEYFKSNSTWGYFSNIILYMSYALPGVFEHNTYPNAVNGSLWSLTTEFGMYMLLMIFGVLRLPRAATPVVAGFMMLLSIFRNHWFSIELICDTWLHVVYISGLELHFSDIAYNVFSRSPMLELHLSYGFH